MSVYAFPDPNSYILADMVFRVDWETMTTVSLCINMSLDPADAITPYSPGEASPGHGRPPGIDCGHPARIFAWVTPWSCPDTPPTEMQSNSR